MSASILINFLPNGHSQMTDSSISPSPAWEAKSLVKSGMQWWKFRSDIVAGILSIILLYPTFGEHLTHTFFWMGATRLRIWNSQGLERMSSPRMAIDSLVIEKIVLDKKEHKHGTDAALPLLCVLDRHQKSSILFHPGHSCKIFLIVAYHMPTTNESPKMQYGGINTFLLIVGNQRKVWMCSSGSFSKFLIKIFAALYFDTHFLAFAI